MRRTLVELLGTIGLTLAAVTSSSCDSGGSTTTTTSADSTDVFAAAADPVNVTVATDASHAGSALIGRDGGTVSATGADGSTFTLDVPANALEDTVTITLTPLSTMSGLPLSGGLVAGVQMSPDGLALGVDATLTIAPAKPVPLENQTFLGYSGTGSDLHLAMPATLDASIQIVVQHFSGDALGSGSSGERASLLLKHASDYEARLDGEIASILAGGRQGNVNGTLDGLTPGDIAKLDDLFESFYGHVVRPRITAANASCANAVLALQTLLRFNQRRLRGGIGPHRNFDADVATVIDAEVSNCAWTALPATVGEFTMAGKICKLDSPFTLTMTTPFGTLPQNFVPSSRSAGAESYSGVLNQTSVQGSGTYTVTGLGEVGTSIHVSDQQCISIQGFQSCGGAQFEIPLKRLDQGCGG